MMRLATLVLVGLALLPGGVFGQGVVVTTYSSPVVAVPPPVTTVTTYSYPAVTTYRAVPAVSYYAPPAVVTYRQPLLRPRTTVVRVRPAAAVVAPAVSTVSYSYSVPVYP